MAGDRLEEHQAPYRPRHDDEVHREWAVAFGTSAGSEAGFRRLLAQYRQPDRYYHTIEHGMEIAELVAPLAAELVPAKQEALVLAAWCHDAVFHTTENEVRSAGVARACAADLGWELHDQELVRELVLATTHLEANPSLEAKLLCDADLAVLAKPWKGYVADVANIRAELGLRSRTAWLTRRRRMLAFFRSRPAIFHSEPAVARWEEQAGANLERESSELERL